MYSFPKKMLLVTTAMALLACAGTSAAADSKDATAPAAAMAQQLQQKGYTVAILPFSYSTKEKSFEDMGSEVQQLMTAYLSANPSVILVERADVDKALSEVELGMSGTVDPDSAAKVGHLTGAQILVTGRIFPVRDDIIIVGKIIGIETGRVYGVTVTFPASAKVTKAAEELAEKVGTDIADKGDTMIAQVQKKDDIIDRLKAAIAGRKLPTISIEISEKSINSDRVDIKAPDLSVDIHQQNTEHSALRPAAETEMGFLLKQLGFDVVDVAESNRHADIEVSGDAFSEFALRKGNLVSAKGNIEIKAIRKADGQTLDIDRQSSVAVDLAVESAGKAAVAKSADALTERLVTAILASLKPQ